MWRTILVIFAVWIASCHAERYKACTTVDNCPSYAHCVDAGAKGQMCLCRAYHRFSNRTWPQGCNETFVPIGISIREKSSVSPDKVYSMIPDKMFAANKNNNSASSARLYENSAWCAPASSDVDYIQIDLGIASNVSMIATQGHGGEPILKYIKEFQIQYSMDKASWMNITEDGSGVGAPQVRIAFDLSLIFIAFQSTN